jgi:hypothetical protein
MIPTPKQPDTYYGSGAVNDHTGETVVQFQRRKRRKEIAQLLEALAPLPGRTLTLMKTMKWRTLCVRRLDGSSCSLCQRLVPGSTRSKCCGGIVVGK